MNNVVATGDKVYAATKAGYKHPEIAGYTIAAKPLVKAEIERREEEILFSEILPLAIKRHRKILEDDKTPPGAAVQAVKLAYDRTFGKGEGGEGKEPHEMTSDEIAKAIAELEAVAMSRAKTVSGSTIDESAQAVRKNDDIFQ